MATTTAELRKLEREVEELRKRVAWLEQENGERKAGASAQTASRDLSENSARLSERERARRILRRAGITRELTAEEKQLAAAWHALPEREKRSG